MAGADGFTAPGFEPVRDVFAAQLADEEIGAGFAAIRDGEVIVNLWGGHRDRKREQAWTQDTLVPVYSTTKPVAAMIMALIAERGALDYEAAVCDVWPEFAAHGKGAVTLAEMLSHQAGVPGFAEPIDPALWLDPPALAEAAAALAPMWAPGSASGYHPLTWGYFAGELAQRASGRSLGTVLRDDVCAPHGIDFHIGLPDSEHGRCAEIARPSRMPDLGPVDAIKNAAFLTKWAAPDRGGAAWRRIEIPSANGHGTALSVAQLFSFYAERGAVLGERIVSEDVFDALSAVRRRGRDLVLPFDLDWRAGILGNSNRFWGPNPDTLGHAGWGGSCGFGDAAERLSGAYVMNRQSHHLMGDPRAMRLIEALYSCL